MDDCPPIQAIPFPTVARFLDCYILQYMEENRPCSFDRMWFAFHLKCFENEWINKDMARAICRSLTDRGYCFYMRGLWTEDGEPAGAGYGITDKGAEYLKFLQNEVSE